MTQLTNFNDTYCNQNSNFHQFYNFGSQRNPEVQYYVREPNGKRPFPVEFELDMEYVPKAKRKFDKISACLENFSISNDEPSRINLDFSSDEEMEEIGDEGNGPSSSAPLVVEPDDEPAVPKKIRLDESVQKYLQKCRQEPYLFLPKGEPLKGNEMVIWQPRLLISPKNDFNMVGRIQEIDDEEEQRVNEKIKERIIENEGMVDADADEETTTGIVELSYGSDHSDIGSSWNSPIPSPSSQIVELDADSPSSLTNGSVTDEDMMEFDD
ncbi:unnamed protein product [Caenorhabditis sp. 36 PRJEB53466]|nr:unnamed protein product [Caenorhabditis sp. 36 PRJEB53466]